VGDTDSTSAAPPGLGEWPGFQIYKCGWWLQQRAERELASTLGLRGREFMVLTMLLASEDLSQQQMATYMSLDPTIMVSLIDRLEREGLCERLRNPADRRRHVVRVTAKGRRLHAQARGLIDRIEDEIFAPWSAEERAQVAELMDRVMEPYWAAKQLSRGRR
jgi:DNA-binding MarR family transcriptional regulator